MVSDGEKSATSSAPGSIDAGSDREEDDGDGEGNEEDLGRGARSRAKVGRSYLVHYPTQSDGISRLMQKERLKQSLESKCRRPMPVINDLYIISSTCHMYYSFLLYNH